MNEGRELRSLLALKGVQEGVCCNGFSYSEFGSSTRSSDICQIADGSDALVNAASGDMDMSMSLACLI